MTMWKLTIKNPIDLNTTLAIIEGDTIDHINCKWQEKYKNNYITSTKLRNLYHTCKTKDKQLIIIEKF